MHSQGPHVFATSVAGNIYPTLKTSIIRGESYAPKCWKYGRIRRHRVLTGTTAGTVYMYVYTCDVF